MNWRSVDSKSGPYHDVVFDQEGVSLVRDLSRFLSRELTALNPVDSDSPSAVRQTLKTKKPGVGILKSKFLVVCFVAEKLTQRQIDEPRP